MPRSNDDLAAARTALDAAYGRADTSAIPAAQLQVLYLEAQAEQVAKLEPQISFEELLLMLEHKTPGPTPTDQNGAAPDWEHAGEDLYARLAEGDGDF